MSKIKEITSDIANEIIETAVRKLEGYPVVNEYRGLFITEENDKFVAIDNMDGDAWTEDFDTREEAENWLLGID